MLLATLALVMLPSCEKAGDGNEPEEQNGKGTEHGQEPGSRGYASDGSRVPAAHLQQSKVNNEKSP